MTTSRTLDDAEFHRGGVSADQHHAQSHTHASHTSIGANDHHAQAHAIEGADHTGTLTATKHSSGYRGGHTFAVASKTGNYTATTSDDHIRCDASSAAFTITLPAATGSGRVYTIKKIDSSANAVTVDANSTEDIDDLDTFVLAAQFECLTIIDAATGKWDVL